MKQKSFGSKYKIYRVEVMGDINTGQGGLTLFVRYLNKINIYALLLGSPPHLRNSKEGQPIWNYSDILSITIIQTPPDECRIKPLLTFITATIELCKSNETLSILLHPPHLYPLPRLRGRG